MSLDQNLFTLYLTPNPSYPAGSVIDLVDKAGTTHYRRRRIVSPQQQVYRIELSDPLSEALLASATAPSATSKHKTVELYNPSNVVELKYTGTLSFRWSFKWETHEFEWKREECFIIRKPDPPVLVAVTKEPPGRIRTASVQILDYNLHRFDIEDRKGLEIVILTALLTFQDASDVYHEPVTTSATPSSSTPASTSTPVSRTTSTSPSDPPPPPPKPAPKKGVERIAELQLGRGQVNEVTVLEEGVVADYARHCAQLLQDDAMLFISVRSCDANQVPKVLHVVEETKRLRYKAGDPDLHQYVLYDNQEPPAAPQKGPRIINLDDEGKGKSKTYTPPKSLTVHLSKIDMPELRPRGAPPDRQQTTRPPHRDQDGGKRKEKERERDKEASKGVKDGRSKPPTPPRHVTSPPQPHSSLHKHRSQYLQPTPSPSSYHPPPIPPRGQVPQQAPGTLRRQSMYGSLNAAEHIYYYNGAPEGTNPSNTNTPPSGFFGRFLGR